MLTVRGSVDPQTCTSISRALNARSLVEARYIPLDTTTSSMIASNQTVIPEGAAVSVNLQKRKPGFYWVHGLNSDGKSTSGYVHQGCVIFASQSALAASPTSKAPRQSNDPCEKLTASLVDVKSLAAYNSLAISERRSLRGTILRTSPIRPNASFRPFA
jgi:hypothetical protein